MVSRLIQIKSLDFVWTIRLRTLASCRRTIANNAHMMRIQRARNVRQHFRHEAGTRREELEAATRHDARRAEHGRKQHPGTTPDGQSSSSSPARRSKGAWHDTWHDTRRAEHGTKQQPHTNLEGRSSKQHPGGRHHARSGIPARRSKGRTRHATRNLPTVQAG